MHIQYKYVVRNKDGSVVRWQEGANVSLDLPGGNADELALDVEDSWNKSKQVRVAAETTTVIISPIISNNQTSLNVCFARGTAAPAAPAALAVEHSIVWVCPAD